MILPCEYWKDCIYCENCYDDDGALYCELKNGCEKIKVNLNVSKREMQKVN